MPSLQRGDVATYFQDSGEGEPLVLICGLSADLQYWRFQAAALSEHYRVVCFDNRGAGRSTAPDHSHTLPDLVEDLVALLDHLEIDSAHVLGHSMGGLIAQLLAVSYPERVKRMVLVGSFAEPDGLLRVAIRNWMAIRRSDMPWENVVRYVSRWAYGPELVNNATVYEAFIAAALSNRYSQTLQGFIRQAEALLAAEASPGLAAMSAPTLVVVGEHDALTPKYLSEQLATLIQGSRLQVLPGAHSGFVEYPEHYNRVILDFLSDGRHASVPEPLH
jgi:pimeloyl-ACP methyl ester carboxylesterase